MAIISNGTTIATGGSLSVSASPPSDFNSVGSYAILFCNPSANLSSGNTRSGSQFYRAYIAGGYISTTVSGTWRLMSEAGTNSRVVLAIRLS